MTWNRNLSHFLGVIFDCWTFHHWIWLVCFYYYLFTLSIMVTWLNICDVRAIYIWRTNMRDHRHWIPVKCLLSPYNLSIDDLFCMIKFRFQQNVYFCKVAWTSATCIYISDYRRWWSLSVKRNIRRFHYNYSLFVDL
jgi:hypothetical protein